jgi:AcrR family transcriptional regulator
MRSHLRQQHILECAKKVFARRGFHAANISHICAEARIGRGTLYQYFDSKKGVFAALVLQIVTRVRERLEADSAVDLPAPESLTRAQVVRWEARRLRGTLGVVFEDEATLRIVLREAAGLDVDIERLLCEIDDGIISLVERDLVAAQKAGIVRDLHPRVTATLMVGAIEKLALTALRGDGPVNLDELALEAARLHSVGTLSDRVPREEE